MADDKKQKPKSDAEKTLPKILRVPRKVVETRENLRKREQWFRKRSDS